MVKLLNDETNRPSTPRRTPDDGGQLYNKLGEYLQDKDCKLNRDVIEQHFGFRLQELQRSSDVDQAADDTTSVSAYSNYKQRIDSLFDDNKSDKEDRIIDNNNIQEEIDKMFQDISIHGFKKSNSFKSLKQITDGDEYQNSKFNKCSKRSERQFVVDYLGSVTLPDKIISLAGLQQSLGDLYIPYIWNKDNLKWTNTLEISKEGLKIQQGGKCQLNPFQTIAVWAAVKFVSRRRMNQLEFAFIPLIADPAGIDKETLFRPALSREQKMIQSNTDAPMFAVVMRKNGVAKQLDCHAFVCKTSEEAIIIAANLYQALIKNMKKKPKKRLDNNDSSDFTTTEREKRNDSSNCTTTERQVQNYENCKKNNKKQPPPVPSRPPRKIKNSPSSSESEDLILELEQVFSGVRREKSEKQTGVRREKNEKQTTPVKEETTTPVMDKPVRLHRRGSEPCNMFSIESAPAVSTLRRSVSERRNGITVQDRDSGDILTKVAIPRSRSFLNANGPLTRYSRRNKSNVKCGIASPLGFNELFNEFKLQEGLESMDEILNAIIDSEGMSFNELKPIYKEFLLKLAVTLTKDELYQRSKNIMRRQRKKKTRSELIRKKPFITTTGLRKVLKKTASKLKTKTNKPSSFEFTSVVFKSNNKQVDTTSTSSYNARIRQGARVQRRQSNSKRNGQFKKMLEHKKLSTSTADHSDSDLLTQRRTINSMKSTTDGGCPNRSSSGYFTCSECSYGSESCTCTSTDKCYCTLGQKKNRRKSNSENDKSNASLQMSGTEVVYEDKDSVVSSCGCDTESCVDSEKCYCNSKQDNGGICQTPHLHKPPQQAQHHTNCPNFNKKQTIFEQLKAQGFAASESSLSRAASPATAWRTNETIIQKECVKPSRSLEFLRPTAVRPPRQGPLAPLPVRNSVRGNYVEGTRHFCFHGTERRNSSVRNRREIPMVRRQYHSMRSRSFDTDAQRLTRSYGSMRLPTVTDSIFDKVLFPAASVNSSLRYPRRIDVYNTKLSRSVSNQYLHNSLQACLVHGSPIVPAVIKHDRNCQHRMNVNPAPPRRTYQHRHHSQQHVLQPSRTTDSEHVTSDTSDVSQGERKVLVVSARDPKGKVLYMGASCRAEKKNKTTVKKKYLHSDTSNACEALSVKKSAEIAALFSDVPKNKLTNTRKDNLYYSKNLKNYSKCYNRSNMENSLGYLP